jgi:hypothetical protein
MLNRTSRVTDRPARRRCRYDYDPLDLYRPPMFPMVKDGSLKVTSWIEQ